MGRILVVGSEGFIGRQLCGDLEASNQDFTTLDILPSNRKGHRQVDLNSDELDIYLKAISANIVIHTAAQTDVRLSMEQPIIDLVSNGLGTLKLVKSVLKYGCSNFIYLNSGGATYEESASLPILETVPARPKSAYGLSKQLGEDYVKMYFGSDDLNWSSLALSNVYGSISDNRKGLFYEVWKAATKSQTIPIYGENVTRDYVHVKDVSRAIIECISNPTNTRVNIGTGIETSNIDALLMIQKLLEIEIKYKILLSRPGEVVRSSLSIDLARKLLDWAPLISISEGIKHSIPMSNSQKD